MAICFWLAAASRSCGGGRIHIIQREGELFVKRLRSRADGLDILSDSPKETTMFAELGAVKILARVVWLARRL